MERDPFVTVKKETTMLRGRKQKTNEYIKSKTVDENTWIEYFTELYNRK